MINKSARARDPLSASLASRSCSPISSPTLMYLYWIHLQGGAEAPIGLCGSILRRICLISLVRSGGPAAALIGRSTGGKTGSLTLVSAQLPKWRSSIPVKLPLTLFEAAERVDRTSIRSSLVSVQSTCQRARLWCVLRSGVNMLISERPLPDFKRSFVRRTAIKRRRKRISIGAIIVSSSVGMHINVLPA